MKCASPAWRRRAAGARALIGAIATLGVLSASLAARAEQLLLKDGRTIEGKIVKLATISNKPQQPKAEGAPNPRLILLCDDGLRRYYFHSTGIGVLQAGPAEPVEKFLIKNQPVAELSPRIAAVGPILRSTPFDEHGRRMVEMLTAKGAITVFLGITEVTPTFVKVQGLRLPDSKSYTWEQRLATTSLPFDVLDKLLRKQIDPKNLDQRLKIVRLYLQMDRYQDAQAELAKVIEDFPEYANKFSAQEREAKQRAAKLMVNEIKLRKAAGQHQFAMEWLKNFPHDGVAGEILQEVRRTIEGYEADIARGKEIVAKIDELLAKLGDTKLNQQFQPIRDEIRAELNLNTLGRMTAFEQVMNDESMPAEERLALATSGWLMGANDSIRKLPVALSLFNVRNKVRLYVEESIKPKREEILADLDSEEGATVDYVTQVVANMLPTRKLPEGADKGNGLYELSINGAPDEPPVTYYVQLPPEYDPHRQYPTIVTLHGAGTTAEQQIDWWAGAPGPNGARIGQAGRYGYIVVSPVWGKEHQSAYGYSLSEHLAVLNSLRDACRHFAIDTDRVFLSGHAMGGDAAWDIGLAHPDLWAGIIPIVAQVGLSDKYPKFYWQEGRFLPIYAIVGELDGDALGRNADMYDKYLTKTGFNFTLAEFQGRGHEHFSDEILRLFDWMGRYKRDFALKDITGYSMRSWDNYFWWVEIDGLPAKTTVDPQDWPAPSGSRPLETTAKVTPTNGISVKTGADRVTVWLSPEMVDFKKRITVSINGRSVKPTRDLTPSLSVLLEDVRTRVARLHPFWAKIESPGGRVNVADAARPAARPAQRAGSK